MKKLILLLLLIPSLAWGQVSTSGVSLSGCSSGGASAAGTWTIAPTAHGETTYPNSYGYAIGTPVTIGAGTVSKLAIKVKAAGDATVMRISLFDGTSDPHRLATGTCTPAGETWCIVTVNYEASAATYIVAYMSDNGSGGSTITIYGDTDSGDGHYIPDTYADFATRTSYGGSDWSVADWSNSWASAICVGTCSGNPD